MFHYSPQMALIVMEYLAPPHVMLRTGLIAGELYPELGAHMASFLARTLFHTSLYALDTAQHRCALLVTLKPSNTKAKSISPLPTVATCKCASVHMLVLSVNDLCFWRLHRLQCWVGRLALSLSVAYVLRCSQGLRGSILESRLRGSEGKH